MNTAAEKVHVLLHTDWDKDIAPFYMLCGDVHDVDDELNLLPRGTECVGPGGGVVSKDQLRRVTCKRCADKATVVAAPVWKVAKA